MSAVGETQYHEGSDLRGGLKEGVTVELSPEREQYGTLARGATRHWCH